MNKLKTGNILFAFTIAAIAGFWLWNEQRKPNSAAIATQTTPSNPSSMPTPPPTQSDNDHSATQPTDNTPKGELPPSVVAQAFVNMYKQVPQGSLFWTKKSYGWEAAFEADHHIMEAEFDNAGKWLETEEESVNEIRMPQKIKERIHTQYPKAILKELEVETTPQGMFYEIELIDDGKEKELYFDDQASPARNIHEDS